MQQRPQKCPLCGGDIDPSTGICSVCGIKLVDLPEPEKKEEPWEVFLKLPGMNEDFARALETAGFTSINELARGNLEDIEKALGMDHTLAERVHEEARNQAIFLCSNCGAFLSPDAEVCPVCGATVYSVDEEEEENEGPEQSDSGDEEGSLYMCPVCGAFISPDSSSCPHCGAVFEGEEALYDEEEEETAAEAEAPLPKIEKEAVTARPISTEKRTEVSGRDEEINRELLEKLQTLDESDKAEETSEKDISLPSETDRTPMPAKAISLGDELVICGNCGAIIPSGELFCPKCGVELVYGERTPVEPETGVDEIMHFFGVEGADLSRYKSTDSESGALYICSNCGAFYPEGADACPVCGTPVSEMERKIPDYEEILSFDMFPGEQGVSICDECGAFVPLDRDKCPVCGADMEEHRYVPSPIPPKDEDYRADVERFFGPLQNVIEQEKEEERHELRICRVCGAFMAEDATECPVCGAKYGEEEVDFNVCPLCGAKVPVDMTVCPICQTPITAEIVGPEVKELEGIEEMEEAGPEVNQVINEDVIERFMKTIDDEELFDDTTRTEKGGLEDFLVHEDEEAESEEFEELDWQEAIEDEGAVEEGEYEADKMGLSGETAPTDMEEESAPEDREEPLPGLEGIEEQEDEIGDTERAEPLDFEEEIMAEDEEGEFLETDYEGAYEEEYELPEVSAEPVYNEFEDEFEEEGKSRDEELPEAEYESEEYEAGMEDRGSLLSDMDKTANLSDGYSHSTREKAVQAETAPRPRTGPSSSPTHNRKSPRREGIRRAKRKPSGRDYRGLRESLLFISLFPAIVLLFIYDFLPQSYILQLSIALFFALLTATGVVMLLVPGGRGWPSRIDLLLLLLSGVIASMFALKWYFIGIDLYSTLDTLVTLGTGILGVYAGSRVKGRGYFLAWLIGSFFMTLFAFMHIFTAPWDSMTVKIIGGVGLAYMMGGGIILVRLKWQELLLASTLKSGDDSYLQRDYERAVKAYERVIQASSPDNNPDYDIPWYSKGAALISLGRFEEAIESLDRALEINPRNEVTWNNKGNALSRLGRHEEAIDCYERALKINPHYEVAWNNKGNAYARIGRLEDALRCYDRAIAINENYREAWINKGYVLVKLGMYEEAVKCANRIIPDRLRRQRTASL